MYDNSQAREGEKDGGRKNADGRAENPDGIGLQAVRFVAAFRRTGADGVLVPTLRDASLRDAPQGEG
jgi:hypothetical protein